MEYSKITKSQSDNRFQIRKISPHFQLDSFIVGLFVGTLVSILLVCFLI